MSGVVDMDRVRDPRSWGLNREEQAARDELVRTGQMRPVRQFQGSSYTPPDEREPDYEQMWEDRMEHGGLDTVGQERQYEKFLDRPWGDA